VALSCLLVDDSKDFLASAKRLLESQGVAVVGCATTGEEALRLAAALEPDVALVDIELGEEDGVALAAELEARSDSLRTILISAHEREDLGELVSDAAAVGFIPKSALGARAIEALLA